MGNRKKAYGKKQRPVTDSMTNEQKKMHDIEVREARYANGISSVDYSYARGGRSIYVEPKPMSDDLSYWPPMKQEVNLNEQEAISMLPYTTQPKAELIQKWNLAIDKLQGQIKVLQNDKTLSVAEKQKKIARRLEIISDYQDSIRRAQEFIEREKQKYKEMYDNLKAKVK